MAKNEKVLVVEDEESLRFVLSKAIANLGYGVETVATIEEGRERLEQQDYILHFLDIRLPDGDGVELLSWIKQKNIGGVSVVMTAEATMQNAIRAMKKGAFEYIVKPFDLSEIEQILKRVEQRRVMASAAKTEPPLPVQGELAEHEIIGQSPAMQRLYKKIGKAAASSFTALITGESGTGKELVARNLHNFSDRSEGPFVAVNCAAIPKELMESELLGNVKGAFTGADRDRKGLIEESDGGTLFMDEVGELSLKMQAKVLRLLEEGTITPVGSRRPVKVDVRFVAATNRDLKQMVKDKKFREDLYHRLNIIPIKIPTLSERPGDIELLVRYFIKKFGEGKKISDEAVEELAARDWPGNVRQLQNTIKRALVMSGDDVLVPGSFTAPDEEAPGEMEGWIARSLAKGGKDIYEQIIGQVEAELIRQALEKCGGNKVKTAKLLGINRNTLSKKLKP